MKFQAEWLATIKALPDTNKKKPRFCGVFYEQRYLTGT